MTGPIKVEGDGLEIDPFSNLPDFKNGMCLEHGESYFRRIPDTDQYECANVAHHGGIRQIGFIDRMPGAKIDR